MINLYSPDLKPRKPVSTAPKGIDPIRAAICKSIAIRKQLHPLDVANQRYEDRGGARRVVEHIKAALPGLTTTGPTGVDMVGTNVGLGRAQLFDMVWAETFLSKLPLIRVPFDTRFLVGDEPPVVGWRIQGKGIKAARPKYTAYAGLTLFSIGAIDVQSDELIDANTTESEILIRDSLVKAIARQIESDFIDPTNAGDNGGGTPTFKPISVSYAAANAGTDSPQETAFELDTFTGRFPDAVILMHPMQAARLYSAARPDIGKDGGTWAGFRVYTSRSIPEAKAILLDGGSVAFAGGQVEVTVSNQADIEMDTSPAGTSVTPTAGNQTPVNMWSSGSTAIRGLAYCNFQLVRPGACKVLDMQSLGLSFGM